MAGKVIVLGGGVAGMSAAHELVERGFQVTVYEKNHIPGGKARSMPIPGSGRDGRRELPGEHGFRFFPSFYMHVTDTMKRIPLEHNKRSVFDNLVPALKAEITQYGKPGLILITHFPRSFGDLMTMLRSAIDLKNVKLKDGELEFFVSRFWQYLTTCEERRLADLEKIGWWDFVDAGNPKRSAAYRKFLAEGLTRSLVAADARLANTRVEGHVGTLMSMGMSEPGVNTDRLLNGPTNDVWIDPWLAYLQKRGVSYHLNTCIETIHYGDGKIAGVTLRRSNGTTFGDHADYYILAVPVEQAARLLAEQRHADLLKADPTLQGVIDLRTHVAWMNGIQFYLKEDLDVVDGHMIHIDSQWSLTSISQRHFWTWTPDDWANVGDGNVKGILSVDISNWEQEGLLDWPVEPGSNILVKKTARQCTRAQIRAEVLAQLMLSLNTQAGHPVLKEENVDRFFLDPDIEDKPETVHSPGLYEDAEPLYVDRADSWHMRPEAYTRIPNFFLASDYVRTNTQLATMEGANEAARRAVNSILSASKSTAPLCKIWALHEPYVLSIWRWYDSRRYQRGEPWKAEFPWFVDAGQWLLAHAAHLSYILTGRKRKVR